MTFVVALRLK